MKASFILNITLAAAVVFLCIKLATKPAEHAPNAEAERAATHNVESPANNPSHEDNAGESDKKLREFDIRNDFTCNPFAFFTGNGLLLAAGDERQSNAMTIGWGNLGTLWGRQRSTVTVYVAEKRYTHGFMERAKYFTVMGFKDENVLHYMGTHSGRDGDKAQALGLHTAYTENGTPYYEEADFVIECRTLYAAPFDPKGFKDDVPKNFYARFEAGLHSFYIGEVVRAMKR